MKIEYRRVAYREMVSSTTKVVVLGESAHVIRPYKKEVKEALSDIRRLGFTHFGMEMFPSDLNQDLRKFSRTGSNLGMLDKHLNEYWNWGSTGQVPDSYRKLLIEARKLGMRVFGLDMPYKEYLDVDKPNEHFKRNVHMAQQIAKVEADGNRVLTFMSHRHALSFPSLGEGVKSLLKKNHGIRATYIRLVGGNARAETPTEIDAKENDVEHKRFYTKGRPGANEVDYILHLPQMSPVRN